MIHGLPEALRAELRDEPVPDWLSPSLATLTDDRFSDPDWIFERKLDGVRVPGVSRRSSGAAAVT